MKNLIIISVFLGIALLIIAIFTNVFILGCVGGGFIIAGLTANIISELKTLKNSNKVKN